MGWGNHPHEGFGEQQRPGGQWTDGMWRTEWGERPVAERAACSCGWRGEQTHRLPQRPAGEYDPLVPQSPEFATYFKALEASSRSQLGTAMTPDKLAVAREMYASGQPATAAIAAVVGVSRASLYGRLASKLDGVSRAGDARGELSA